MNTDQLIAKLDELIAATRSAAIPANMRGDAKEWIEHDDGRTECTAFVPLGAAQLQRDDRTIDIFGEST